MYLLLVVLLLLQLLQLLLLLLDLLLQTGQLLLSDGMGRIQRNTTVSVSSVVNPTPIPYSAQETFQGVGIIDHVQQTLPIVIHIRQVLNGSNQVRIIDHVVSSTLVNQANLKRKGTIDVRYRWRRSHIRQAISWANHERAPPKYISTR
jgi:hypothetical protein